MSLAASSENVLANFDEMLRAADGTLRAHQRFTFVRKGPPRRLPHDGQRISIQVTYGARLWTTIKADLSTAGVSDLPREAVPAIDLTALGLRGPTTLQVLHLSVQIPQKLHGMTRPPRDGEARNDRVRDLVDLLLLQDQLPALAALRDGCVTEFARESTHAWPPTVLAHPHWEDEYARLARQYGVLFPTLIEGVREAQAIVDRIEAAD